MDFRLQFFVNVRHVVVLHWFALSEIENGRAKGAIPFAARKVTYANTGVKQETPILVFFSRFYVKNPRSLRFVATEKAINP